MAWLSLTAVLLLALLPTAGRLWGHGAGDVPPQMLLMEMCTSSADKLVRMVDPFELLIAADTAREHPDHASQADCDYCPVLASMLVVLLWLLHSLLQLRASPASAGRHLRHAGRHPCGLGSRGPPLLIA